MSRGHYYYYTQLYAKIPFSTCDLIYTRMHTYLKARISHSFHSQLYITKKLTRDSRIVINGSPICI